MDLDRLKRYIINQIHEDELRVSQSARAQHHDCAKKFRYDIAVAKSILAEIEEEEHGLQRSDACSEGISTDRPGEESGWNTHPGITYDKDRAKEISNSGLNLQFEAYTPSERRPSSDFNGDRIELPLPSGIITSY